MIRKEKRAGKKYWILTVFAAFIAIAMSFVSWLIYAVFSQSYREIKQQYYGVVSRQIVEDIENSIRNGKQIERFYGMDKVLSDMLAIISTDQVPVNTAITDVSGNILYSSYSGSGSEAEYAEMCIRDRRSTTRLFRGTIRSEKHCVATSALRRTMRAQPPEQRSAR